MIEITLGQRRAQVAGTPGETLLDVAHAGGVPLRYACRRADCGTCAVRVSGPGLEAPAENEVAVLHHLGLSPATHRLACQARIAAGTVALVVEIPQ
jgi:ferredoxin